MVLTPINLDSFLVTRNSLSSRSLVEHGARRSTGTSSWFPGIGVESPCRARTKDRRGDRATVDWLDVGRLCERPGCSEPGAASYGMVPEDLLFWVDTFHPADRLDTGVLCRRHADAMVVPRGWTLDDRRESQPRLFRSSVDASGAITRPKRRSRTVSTNGARQPVEQLELQAAGTGHHRAHRFGRRPPCPRPPCRRPLDAVDAGVRQRRRPRRAARRGEPLARPRLPGDRPGPMTSPCR